MGTNLIVRDYAGTIVRRSFVDMRELLEAARQADQPFLGCVDRYDETVFNRLQVEVIAAELGRIKYDPSVEPALAELKSMIADVHQRPHRYLVFRGD